MSNNSPANTSSQGSGGVDQQADRRAKREKLRQEFGIDPYGIRTEGLLDLDAARALYDAQADEQYKARDKGDTAPDPRPTVKVAGRIVMHRDIGKLVFMTIRMMGHDLQLAISSKAVDETSMKLAKLADLGDIVIATGPLGTTKTGEITVWATGDGAFQLASKALIPPPDKYHGLTDPELRFRQRYVDLYHNQTAADIFRKRSLIIKAIRDFLYDPPEPLGPGYMEVETPMMQPIAGGAAARPFITHHNTLDIDLFLRIAPELYLKRLLVGGMPRVFEINRNFRNEGISPRHNPEFTMLELYQAFGDYQTMMDLTEAMIRQLAGQFASDDAELDLTQPFRRATYHELFEEHAGFAIDDEPKLRDKAKQLHIELADKPLDILGNEVWEELVEPHLIAPTFVMDYPASLCPLTRTKPDKPTIAERFELYINRMEIANAYTELNDPDVQLANFQQQMAGIDDEEQTFRAMDADFIEALRVGMPPAGGLGIGIDRLVMLLTGQSNIREVILFPLMRPEATTSESAAKTSEQPPADE